MDEMRCPWCDTKLVYRGINANFDTVTEKWWCPECKERIETIERGLRNTDDTQQPAHHMGDFPYGKCPSCEEVGNAIYDEPSDEDHIQLDYFECEACGHVYYYQTCYAYRFGSIDNDR
jgi:phage FluMu protein Com